MRYYVTVEETRIATYLVYAEDEEQARDEFRDGYREEDDLCEQRVIAVAEDTGEAAT